EVPESVAALVLAGRIIGVRQPGHIDDALLLAQALSCDRNARRDAAGHHDHLVALDHATGTLTGCVRIRLSIAGHKLYFLAEDAISLQDRRLHRIEHAAVALAVNVLDGELISLQLIEPLLRIRAGL